MSEQESYRTDIGGTPNTIINNRRRAEKLAKKAEKHANNPKNHQDRDRKKR